MININVYLSAPLRPLSDETINYPPRADHTNQVPRSSVPLSSSCSPFHGLHDRLFISCPPPRSHQGSTPGTRNSPSLSAVHNAGFFGINPLVCLWTLFHETIDSVTIVTTDARSIRLLFYGREMIARNLEDIWS